MTNTIARPDFEEIVGVTVMNFSDVGLKFNANEVGSMNFAELRSADYGPGFIMPTMLELSLLVHASLENQNYQTAKNVIRILMNTGLTGNTGILYVLKGMFVQDNPHLEDRKILMHQETLEKRLGSTEEKGVVFSDDRKIRFAPYGFKIGEQTALELSKNPGVIALVAGEENAEKLAKASRHCRSNPYLWVMSDVKKPETKVAGLGSGGAIDSSGLVVVGDDWRNCRYGYAFGVSKDTKNVVHKN